MKPMLWSGMFRFETEGKILYFLSLERSKKTCKISSMKKQIIGLLSVLSVGWTPLAGAMECQSVQYETIDYSVCTVNPAEDDIRFFLKDEKGDAYGHFNSLRDALTATGEDLVFAMNGGMYLKDHSPAGLYIEKSDEKKRVNTRSGPGNFHLLPNGVFWLSDLGEGRLHSFVAETAKYVSDAEDVVYATQSGPMLVIDGALHPKFLKGSESRKIRNGVGVREGSSEIVFVKSEAPVNFYDFATLFKGELKTENALYLDGTISRLYSKQLGRNDLGLRMGPIIGVVEAKVFEQSEGYKNN